jgi:hypothetical protein
MVSLTEYEEQWNIYVKEAYQVIGKYEGKNSTQYHRDMLETELHHLFEKYSVRMVSPCPRIRIIWDRYSDPYQFAIVVTKQ